MITRYTSGKSLKEQINEIISNDMMDENTRLFFNKSNYVTTEDIRDLVGHFDIIIDNDFDNKNVVFKPTESILRIVNRGGKL